MNKSLAYPGRQVYVVDGSRTPFLCARAQPGPFAAVDLAVATGQQLLNRQAFAPTELDEVVTGCVIPSAQEANIARLIALRLHCGAKVPAWTVQRNCASGMQALDSAAQAIATGRHDLVLAGGVDAMSHAPLLFQSGMASWLGPLLTAKTISARLKQISKFRLHFLKPIFSLLNGLRDPIVGLNMGQTAENLADLFQIDRTSMDKFALRSHQRLAKAQDENLYAEITPIFDHHGNTYTRDDGLRRQTTLAKLAKLKPFFDKKFGSVTPGNSSQITDGAAFLILASATAIKKYKLPILGRIVDAQWAALDPAQMGLGPVHASTPLLQRHKLKLTSIDYWEMNEAFAAQVIACLKAWNDKTYCKEQLGLRSKLGQLDETRLNVQGGAIALGHPVGASGARLVLQLLHILRRHEARRGIATLCIGGGQGGAMLLESTDKLVAEGKK